MNVHCFLVDHDGVRKWDEHLRLDNGAGASGALIGMQLVKI